MTCSQCGQHHEQDPSFELGFAAGFAGEMGEAGEGDLVEDFEANLGDLDLEGDAGGAAGYDEDEADVGYGGDFETRRRIGDLDFEQGDEGLEPEVIGRDTRVRVLATTRPPFRFVCNLEYDLPKIGRRSMCTGTLVGPSTVLTAGHCIAGLDPKRLRVIPGRNGTLEPLPATQATNLTLFPGYSGASATDIGIVHLANPVGNAVGYWTRAYARGKGDAIGTSILSGSLPLPPGKLKVNLSGYPADKPSGKKAWCRDPKRPANRCRHSLLGDPKRSASCGTQQFRAYDLLVERSGRILHYLNDTCPGHSGSPVWVRRHPSKGGRVLVAVHVSGDAPPHPKANRAVLIDGAVRQFLVANTR